MKCKTPGCDCLLAGRPDEHEQLCCDCFDYYFCADDDEADGDFIWMCCLGEHMRHGEFEL